VVTHEPTSTSLQAARAASIAPHQLAKAALLEEDGHYVMVVLSTARHIRLGELRRHFQRNLSLAPERAVASLFQDCIPGAMPALGPAYDMDTIWDDSLMNESELYFEAGDHEHLIHMRTHDYLWLVRDCPHGAFSEPV
jgi:Ala-tRNA(Pro) deacylase